MAGHAQGRGQPYPHRPSQSSQSRQQADSKGLNQGTASNPTPQGPNAASNAPKPRLRTSCDRCQEAKLGCSQEKPTCRRCSRHGIPCVYSPFRRIGRPRKSTNPRSANGGNNNAKSRPKIDDADEVIKVEPIENLSELETDGHRGSLFAESIPAPPSSPASTENGSGAWYPWTADGNSLHNGLQLNFENPGSMIDSMDPFSSSTDYLDYDLYFDNHHKSLMDCTISEGDGAALGLGQSMQPTPPSSTTAEMMVFGETMLKDSDSHGMSTLLSQHPQQDHPSTHGSSGSISSSNIAQLNLGTTPPDRNHSDAFRNNELTIHPPSQLPSSLRSNGQIFVPTPELTPPPIDQSPQTFSPCTQRCSSSLIQQLATLNQVLSDGKNPSLDLVLRTEKETYSLCRKIINCSPCMGNRSSFLLFSMVVEQVMRLLETIPDEAASNACTVLVGSFEIDDDTKASFLKRLLLSRLGHFRNMLREFKQTIDTDADDYNSNVAKDMAGDVYNRLDVLKGAIERWK